MPFRFIHLTVAALALGYLASGSEINEAAKRGDLEKLSALLKQNPALALSSDETGWTPLHLAAQRGFKEVAELLLAYKAPVNAKSKRGDTPLHWAANGHKEVAELLLAKKADVNAVDNGGWTPLHMAARAGRKDMLELLLAHKADINAKDKDGVTPLSRAMAQGHRDVVEYLRERGGRS
jgi:ankyrin repeat protein